MFFPLWCTPFSLVGERRRFPSFLRASFELLQISFLRCEDKRLSQSLVAVISFGAERIYFPANVKGAHLPPRKLPVPFLRNGEGRRNTLFPPFEGSLSTEDPLLFEFRRGIAFAWWAPTPITMSGSESVDCPNLVFFPEAEEGCVTDGVTLFPKIFWRNPLQVPGVGLSTVLFLRLNHFLLFSRMRGTRDLPFDPLFD